MKYKVFNYNKYSYGIKLMDGVREVVVPPHNGKMAGFIMLDEEEIYYLNSISPRTFREGYLVTEPELMANMGFLVDNATVLSDDEIEGILKGNINKMKSELKKMEGKHMFDRVTRLAKNLDLPLSKLKIVQEITGILLVDELES